MAIREGRWDCPQCGNKGIRGGETKCPACGRLRGNDVQFYVADDAVAVEDAKALERAQAGADCICEFCGALTPAAERRCKSCGADRSEKRREQKEILDKPAAPPPAPPKKGSGGKIALGLALLAVAGGFFLCRSKEAPMKAEALSWERTVEVEKFATVVEEDWREELPAGARIQGTERKVHHHDKVQTGTRQVTRQVEEQVQTGTRKVKVGKKDLGNGYFEDLFEDEPVYEKRTRSVTENEPVYREDPVYADWCRYEIDKWVKDRVERAAGTDRNPRWPEVAATAAQRPGKKTELYRVAFRDAEGKEHVWEPELAVWQGLEAGREYRVVTRLGKVTGLAETK